MLNLQDAEITNDLKSVVDVYIKFEMPFRR